MYSLIYYIPPQDHERVKQALFEQGAGKIGSYDQSCWEISGMGQFRPLSGSHPAIGQQHQLQRLEEVRVEMVCSEQVIKAVLRTLLKVHPYEQPAYQINRILSLQDL